MGVWSSLKSPVWSTDPAGVLMYTPSAAGMECVMLKKSMLKTPRLMWVPFLTSRNLGEFSLNSCSFASIMPSVSLDE